MMDKQNTIPRGWKETTLGEVAEIRRGASPRPIHDYISSQGLPWIKISDVSSLESRFLEETREFIKSEGETSTVIVNKGDLILSNSATPGIPKFVNIRAGIHDGWLLLKEKTIDKNFLYYLLINLRPELLKVADGAVFKNLKIDLVKEHKITIPKDIAEQRAIVAVLSSLDDKIELLREENKTLEAIAQTIFKEWFVNFNFPGATGKMIDSELGKIPEGWRVGKLKDEFTIIMGQSPNGESYNENGEGMTFFQGRAEFQERFPEKRLSTTEPKRLAEQFDVLVSVRAPVGDINVASEKCCIGRGLGAVRGEYKTYTLYKIKSLKDNFEKFESDGTVFGSMSKEDFENISGVIPGEGIIIDFEKNINCLDKKIFNNYAQIQNLSSLRDVLLPKLTRGDMCIKEI